MMMWIINLLNCVLDPRNNNFNCNPRQRRDQWAAPKCVFLRIAANSVLYFYSI